MNSPSVTQLVSCRGWMQTRAPGTKVHASCHLLHCTVPSYHRHVSPGCLPHLTMSPPRVGAVVFILSPTGPHTVPGLEQFPLTVY